MQVHIVISDTDSTIQRNVAQAVMNLVYNRGTPVKLAPEDNPAVGGGVPPAPLDLSQPEHSDGSAVSASTGGVTLSATPGLPAELVHPATPTGPSNTPGGMPTLDKDGLPWDARIHSDSKNLNADGTWRKRRNLDKSGIDVAAVEAELRAIYGTTDQQSGGLTAEQRNAANQWQVAGVSPETAAAVQAGVPVTVSPAEAAAVAAASQASMQVAHAAAVPAPTTPAPAPHLAILQQIGPHIITDANPQGFLKATDVAEVCKQLQIVDAGGNGAVQRLNEFPHMLDGFKALINGRLTVAAALSGRQAPVIQ